MLDEIESQLRGLTQSKEAAGDAELYQLALQTVLIEADLSLLSDTLSTQLRAHKATLDNLGPLPRFGGPAEPQTLSEARKREMEVGGHLNFTRATVVYQSARTTRLLGSIVKLRSEYSR